MELKSLLHQVGTLIGRGGDSNAEEARQLLEQYSAERAKGAIEPHMIHVAGDIYAGWLRSSLPAEPNRFLFIVSVKYERRAREKKWPVSRFVVVARDEVEAREMVTRDGAASGVLHMFARRATAHVIKRDNYLADNGNPFSGKVQFNESPIFAEK